MSSAPVGAGNFTNSPVHHASLYGSGPVRRATLHSRRRRQQLEAAFYLRFCSSGGGTRTHNLRIKSSVERRRSERPTSPELRVFVSVIPIASRSLTGMRRGQRSTGRCHFDRTEPTSAIAAPRGSDTRRIESTATGSHRLDRLGGMDLAECVHTPDTAHARPYGSREAP
jgi:hypothetical protein